MNHSAMNPQDVAILRGRRNCTAAGGPTGYGAWGTYGSWTDYIPAVAAYDAISNYYNTGSVTGSSAPSSSAAFAQAKAQAQTVVASWTGSGGWQYQQMANGSIYSVNNNTTYAPNSSNWKAIQNERATLGNQGTTRVFTSPATTGTSPFAPPTNAASPLAWTQTPGMSQSSAAVGSLPIVSTSSSTLKTIAEYALPVAAGLAALVVIAAIAKKKSVS